MRLIGIVSHKTPRKREDFPQVAGFIAPFLHKPSAVPAKQDAWKPSLKGTSSKFQRRHSCSGGKNNRIYFRQSTAWRFCTLCVILNILCLSSHKHFSICPQGCILQVLGQFIHFYIYLRHIYRSFISYQEPTYLHTLSHLLFQTPLRSRQHCWYCRCIIVQITKMGLREQLRSKLTNCRAELRTWKWLIFKLTFPCMETAVTTPPPPCHPSVHK